MMVLHTVICICVCGIFGKELPCVAGTYSRSLQFLPMSELVVRPQRGSHQSAGMCRTRVLMQARLEAMKRAETYKHECVIKSPQGTRVMIKNVKRRLINFCAGNYLGLANHPEVVAAGQTAMYQYGNGMSSVRFVCGTHKLHKKLEKKLSKFHRKEDTILYGSAYAAHCGLYRALLTSQDAVFSDANNHGAINDGIRLCKAKSFRYPNGDVKKLAGLLTINKAARIKLIVTDGVFGMDGTTSPLRELRQIADFHEAVLVVDDAHATGVTGCHGRGTEDYYCIEGAADIITSTLGKALGGATGGYITGPREIIAVLRNVSRPYLLSNSLPLPVVGAALKALKMVRKRPDIRYYLHENTMQFRCGVQEAGFCVSGEDHPVCPVMLQDARLAREFARRLFKKGFFVSPFCYPVVRKDSARIRVQITADHSPDEIDNLVAAFKRVGRKIGFLKKKNDFYC